MRVAITDYTFDSLDVEKSVLEPLGLTVTGGQNKTPEALVNFVGDADFVITQFAPVNAAVIGAMKKARVIVRYGIGVDNVDLAAAKERGIPVCNVPDYCIDEVADHTLAFILASTRGVVANANLVRGGKWGLATPIGSMRTLRDSTVGVVGFGRIGREVVRRLAAFKGTVLVSDPVVAPAEIEKQGEANVKAATLDEVFSRSDLITLHCPSTASTRRMINAKSIAAMKPGVVIVNLSRGDLIDTAALVDALGAGRVSAAALDVCDPEPVPLDSPLRTMDNVVLASHIASVSPKAVRTLRESAANAVAATFRGDPLPSVVNGVTAPRAV